MLQFGCGVQSHRLVLAACGVSRRLLCQGLLGQSMLQLGPVAQLLCGLLDVTRAHILWGQPRHAHVLRTTHQTYIDCKAIPAEVACHAAAATVAQHSVPQSTVLREACLDSWVETPATKNRSQLPCIVYAVSAGGELCRFAAHERMRAVLQRGCNGHNALERLRSPGA